MRRLAGTIGILVVIAATVWMADHSSVDQQEATTAPLVILDGSKVFTLTPGQADRLDLVDAPTSRFLLPAWSPDGTSVAIPQIDNDGVTTLVVVEPGVGLIGSVLTPNAAFYLYWDPTATSIAYLSQDLELSLRLATPSTGDDVELGRGAPFYLSWSTDGSALLTHVGTNRFEELALDGSTRAIGDVAPGRYRAPQWLPDNTYLAALDDSGLDRLVILDRDGAVIDEIAVYAGIGTFTMSPAHDRVAYQFDLDPNDDFLSTQTGTPAGTLVVSDRRSGASTTLTDQTALGWWWSPSGDELIFVTLTGSRDLPLTWNLWDGNEVTELENFGPSLNFLRDFLPFFDQFAQSMTLWSPDGSAFVYAGTGADGASGIWVHTIGEGAARVSDGTFASWSPGIRGN